MNGGVAAEVVVVALPLAYTKHCDDQTMLLDLVNVKLRLKVSRRSDVFLF